MSSFKISNSSTEEMYIFFEPIGDTFVLPSNGILQIITYDEGSGLGTDALDIVVKTENGKTSIVIWAETHKFSALFEGKRINTM